MISTSRIQTNELEPIKYAARDILGAPLTGKTDLLVKIYRRSDGQYLDWTGMTFKAAGWTTLQQTMTEVDAVNLQGIYRTDFDTSLIFNPNTDDIYVFSIDQSPGTDVIGMPVEGEIKVGNWLDFVDAPISTRAQPGDQVTLTAAERITLVDDMWDELLSGHTTSGSAGEQLGLIRKLLTNRLWLASGASGNWVLYDDDNSVLLTWDVTDVNGAAIINDPGVPARRNKGA
jgi:hypothetical protein